MAANTIEQKLSELLSDPNSLSYSLENLKLRYNWTVLLEDEGSEIRAEAWAIASTLCGDSGLKMAMKFMEGFDYVEEFLHNVSFNGKRSNPLILRAINIRLSGALPKKELKSGYTIAKELGLEINQGINWATVKCSNKEVAENFLSLLDKNDIRCDIIGTEVRFHL